MAKVSWSTGSFDACCCGECCMYPAAALTDGLYTIDDLPDEIDFTYIGIQTNGPYTLTRTGMEFRGGPDDEVVIQLLGGADFWGSSDGGGGLETFACLINKNLYQQLDDRYIITVDDKFADTYAISGPISGTVTRNKDENLCLWSGNGITLKYNGFLKFNNQTQEYDAFGSFKFTVNGYSKSGFQNTPQGNYGPYSVT